MFLSNQLFKEVVAALDAHKNITISANTKKFVTFALEDKTYYFHQGQPESGTIDARTSSTHLFFLNQKKYTALVVLTPPDAIAIYTNAPENQADELIENVCAQMPTYAQTIAIHRPDHSIIYEKTTCFDDAWKQPAASPTTSIYYRKKDAVDQNNHTKVTNTITAKAAATQLLAVIGVTPAKQKQKQAQSLRKGTERIADSAPLKPKSWFGRIVNAIKNLFAPPPDAHKTVDEIIKEIIGLDTKEAVEALKKHHRNFFIKNGAALETLLLDPKMDQPKRKALLAVIQNDWSFVGKNLRQALTQKSLGDVVEITTDIDRLIALEEKIKDRIAKSDAGKQWLQHVAPLNAAFAALKARCAGRNVQIAQYAAGIEEKLGELKSKYPATPVSTPVLTPMNINMLVSNLLAKPPSFEECYRLLRQVNATEGETLCGLLYEKIVPHTVVESSLNSEETKTLCADLILTLQLPGCTIRELCTLLTTYASPEAAKAFLINNPELFTKRQRDLSDNPKKDLRCILFSEITKPKNKQAVGEALLSLSIDFSHAPKEFFDLLNTLPAETLKEMRALENNQDMILNNIESFITLWANSTNEKKRYLYDGTCAFQDKLSERCQEYEKALAALQNQDQDQDREALNRYYGVIIDILVYKFSASSPEMNPQLLTDIDQLLKIIKNNGLLKRLTDLRKDACQVLLVREGKKILGQHESRQTPSASYLATLSSYLATVPPEDVSNDQDLKGLVDNIRLITNNPAQTNTAKDQRVLFERFFLSKNTDALKIAIEKLQAQPSSPPALVA